MKTNQEAKLQNNEVYESPTIEIVEMETEGNILAGSSGGDDFEPGGGWSGW